MAAANADDSKLTYITRCRIPNPASNHPNTKATSGAMRRAARGLSAVRAIRRSESISSEERKQWLAKKPVKTWSVDLPPTKDFKERGEEITPPKELKPGS